MQPRRVATARLRAAAAVRIVDHDGISDMEYDSKRGIERFHRNGFEVVPSVLSAQECGAMAEALECIENDLPAGDGRRWVGSQVHLRDAIFESLIDRAPCVDMAEEMLAFDHGTVDGPPPDSNCHVINMTSITARPGDPGLRWHMDDVLMFPRPAEVLPLVCDAYPA
jgi:hypothetical protein